MTPEQMEFARKYGITKCPPGPETPMNWGGKRYCGRHFTEESEQGFVRMVSGRPGVRRFGTRDLKKQRMH
jgi:hypothetical protein